MDMIFSFFNGKYYCLNNVKEQSSIIVQFNKRENEKLMSRKMFILPWYSFEAFPLLFQRGSAIDLEISLSWLNQQNKRGLVLPL